MPIPLMIMIDKGAIRGPAVNSDPGIILSKLRNKNNALKGQYSPKASGLLYHKPGGWMI